MQAAQSKDTQAAQTDRQLGSEGYLASYIGALLGTIPGGLVGGYVGQAYAEARFEGPWEAIGGIGYVILGLYYGAAVGAGIGCWIALLMRRQPFAFATGAVLAVLLVAGLMFWSGLLLETGPVLSVFLPSVGVLISPFVARAVGLSLASGVDSTSPS